MLTYWETLTAIQSNVPVNDSYAQLWGRKAQGGYTVTTYTGTLPATLTGTKAGYLHRYKIYGNTEQTGTPTPENPIMPQECGERTENLVDYNDVTRVTVRDANYWGMPYTLETGNYVFKAFVGIKGAYLYATIKHSDGTYSENYYIIVEKSVYSRRLSISEGDVLYIFNASAAGTQQQTISICREGQIMLTSGSTAPTSYEPYGYKLPLTSGNTPVDIYIGDDTISAEEYVDSGTGKIYRMVSGTLTPVDPPLPLPQIPTSANSTTISWAGEGLAPSQVELEYEKKR